MTSSEIEVKKSNSRYKGLILAAGEGARIVVDIPLPKALLEINGETLLMHNIKKLLAVNIAEVVVAVGCRAQEVIRYLLEQDLSINLCFVHQKERLGTAHVVKIAKEMLENHPFVLIYVDNFTEYRLDHLIKEHEEMGNIATLALFRAPEPKKHGIAQIEHRRLLKIVEKPENPTSNLAFAGMAVFEKEIFPAIRKVKLSSKGEYYLTDAINILTREGQRVGYTILSGWRVNVNTLEELKKARRLAGLASMPGKNSEVENPGPRSKNTNISPRYNI